MKRPLRPEEAQLWSKVAATVRPGRGRRRQMALDLAAAKLAALDSYPQGASPMPEAPLGIPAPKPPPRFEGKHKPPGPTPKPAASHTAPAVPTSPEPIEPRRKRRIVREQELGPTLDLHGLDQDRARAVLVGFLSRASDEGWRAVLVITGKGSLGGGILRRMTPEWLADPALRHIVAGVSEAHRSHGGAGALYVALKRRRNP